ncbi:MAG: nicotinate-nucleotide adenylyltransferase [Hyphomicrobiaceae bacterium]|nr:nicotinate-nucleotide adenylyltransferase [Hyphomicrobiaceae bacterium]
MTVGLYGGSFDPVHEAHLMVAARAVKRLGLDRLWWLVTPGNPLKAHTPEGGLQARMAAIRTRLTDRRQAVLGIEAVLGTPYTARTIAILQTMRPGVRFVWIMGGDSLSGFHRWQDWRDIARRVPLAIAGRPGAEFAPLSAPAARFLARARIDGSDIGGLARMRPPVWAMMRGPRSPLSSSALRSASALQAQSAAERHPKDTACGLVLS